MNVKKKKVAKGPVIHGDTAKTVAWKKKKKKFDWNNIKKPKKETTMNRWRTKKGSGFVSSLNTPDFSKIENDS